MGNYKFRFSDMIPNAWFYKLKDMNKNRPKTAAGFNPTNTNKKHSSSSSSSTSLSSSSAHPPHLSEQRKSYHFTRDLTFQPIQKIPPTTKKRRNRRTRGCSCRATLQSVWTKPDPDSSLDVSSPSTSDPDSVLTEYGSGNDVVLSCSGSCQLSSGNDVVIDLIDENNNQLPSIVTNNKNEATNIQTTSTEISEKNKYGSLSVKLVKENIVNSPSPRRFSVTSSSPGVKLRTNSPRIVNRRIQGRRSVSSNSSSGGSRRSVSESVAVVKSSKDPMKDFRESMVEMIVENNIRASKDLEELLACYLSLNSDEYHDVIVNVFKQIWFEFIHLRLK